jgi:4-amino-4-deoxy-L-arabinose transferase-like glycosyltransferase
VPSGTSRQRYVWLALIALLGLGAAVLRFETLGARELWYDEIYTDRICRAAATLPDVWRVAAEDGWQHPPLHYALTFLALRLGDSLAYFRLPSALAGVAAVLLLAWLGRTLFGARAGLAAGLLLATSVYHVAYSVDARPYALLVALVVAQYLAFEVAARGRPLAWVLFVLSGSAALYTHHTALVAEAGFGLLAAAGVAAAWRAGPPGAAARRRALRAAAAPLAAFAAIGLLYAPQLANLSQFYAFQIEAKHTLVLTPGLLYDVVARFGAGPGWPAALFALAFGAGVVAILRRRDRSAGVLVFVVAPFLPYVLIPFSKFFDLRFAIVALPAFHLVVAAGVVFLGELAASGVRALRGPAGACVAPVAGALVVGALVLPSLSACATFRTSRVLCGNFFLDPAILDAHGGFCRRHLILNSLADPSLLRARSAAPLRAN